MAKYFLTLDQSTSATKVILYDRTGTQLDHESLEHQQIYPEPGWVEHDPEEIWNNTLSVIQTVLKRNPDKAESIANLSITNQRETILVFDKTTGKPLHNAIVWQCRRGDSICKSLIDEGHNKTVRNKTGLKIDSYFSASKLKWLVNHNEEIKQKLIKGDALIGTIDTYLIYRLTLGKSFATDHTNASRTLLYDVVNLKWDQTLCDLFEVPIQSLPNVIESKANFGATDIDGLLENPIPICGVMGDSQAALFAQRCFKPGMIKATFGTGSSVLMNIGSTFNLTDSGAMTTIAWMIDGNITYSFEGIINYAAATIAWLQNQLELINDPNETENLALSVEDNGGVYLIPAFAGLSAPYWDPDARAAVIGLSAHSTKAHVVRASLESISYQIRDVLDMMNQDTGLDLQSIHADGGATANRFLMQFTADITGLDIQISDTPGFSPLGAFMMGVMGIGEYSSLSDLNEMARNSVTLKPVMDEKSKKMLYSGWKKAVQRVLN